METTTSARQEFAQKTAGELLRQLGFEAEVRAEETDGIIRLQLITNRDDLFIGRGSDPLLALQHLVRIILRTAFPDFDAGVSVNIGDYHEQQEARLTELAKNAAAQARTTQLAVHLPAMSSFERRIVHLVVGNEPGVSSESDGVGVARRIVVRPTDA